MAEKVKGPASYFPAIEKAYGQPVQHWLDLIATQLDQPHMKIVALLKERHGLGHGHANALVAFALARRKDGQSPGAETS